MPTGTCLCGEIQISYTGDPKYTAICYCHDDRKMANTQVFQVPKENSSLVRGEPKVYTKKSDHGNDISSHFCATCGTTVYRMGGAAESGECDGVRAGVLDDQSLLDTLPAVEVYVERRPPWVKRVEGAVQLDEKYERCD